MGKTPLADEIETTSEFILKKLRSFVQPPGRKGTWLKRLNDHQLAEVYHRLRARQNVYHVVQVAQKDWQVLPRSKPESLCRAMRAFREKALGLIEEYRQGHPQTKARTTQADKMKKRAERIQKRVDAMEELSWLIRTQKERLKIMLERESLAIPSKETNRTVAELREILDVYLCHAEELGIVDRRPREFDLTVKTKFDELLDGVVKDEGAALADSALRFLEEAGRRAIPMRASEDGVFRAEEKKVAAG